MSRRLSFTTVTPFSKLLAMILFIVFPLITFYLGELYGRGTAIITPIPPPDMISLQPHSCSEEAKICPDGSYVFRKLPDCTFRTCSAPQNTISPSIPPKTIQQFQSKQDQIAFQLSQKTSINPDALLISYVNSPSNENMYAGGSFITQKNPTPRYFFAAMINGTWRLTAISQNTPNCTDINPYSYPKTLVPACKDAKSNIVAR